MSLTIITLNSTDNGSTSRNTINANFAAILASYPTSGIVVGTTDTQNVSNKTFSSCIYTSPVINWGSDANGDILQRLSGAYTRLGIGTVGQVLTVSTGPVASWQNPSTVNGGYVADTGSANAYAVTPNPVFVAYTGGMQLEFIAANTNTTASTLNVNAIGVKTIKKGAGATDLAAGDIVAGMLVQVEYNATSGFFIMLNPVAGTVSLTAGVYPAGDGTAITGVGTKIATVIGDVTIASSTAETTLVTQSIPGGILGTSNAIRVRAYFTALNVSGTTNNVAFRFKYGSTTLITKTIATNATQGAGTNYSGWIEFVLYANASASIQEGVATINFGSSQNTIGNAAGTISGYQALISTAVGTAAEASAGALNIIVTAQFSNNGVNDNLTMVNAVVEKIS